jgi:hypothetical protein
VDWELRSPSASAIEASDDGSIRRGEDIPPWLHIEPTSGHLSPAETTTITIKMGISSTPGFGLADPGTAEALVQSTTGQATCAMSCTLVLHVEGGADHFLVVDGVYQPSFFGLEVGTIAQRQALGFGPRDHEFAWKAPEYATIMGAPFAESQWEAVPTQLRALLHFLSRCVLLSREPCFGSPGQRLQVGLLGEREHCKAPNKLFI